MNAYLDSSVVLRLALGEPGRLEGWAGYELRVASDLAEVECLRTLDRLRLRQDIGEGEVVERREALFTLLEACELVELSPRILQRASEPFPVSLGTLDALHLATALLWRQERGESLLMATHDEALGQAARAFGMPVAGL